MTQKKVYCYQVCAHEDCDFTEILLACNHFKPITIDNKKIEVKYVKNHTDSTVSGIFITTKIDGIPPEHVPGEEDFSAITLKEGAGLAYPNAFLYSKSNNVLLIELNRMGVTPKNICEYFSSIEIEEDVPEIDLGLNILLSADAFDRIKNMDSILKLEIQVAKPTQIIRDGYADSATVKEVGKLSSALNATKSSYMVFQGELQNGGIRKQSVIDVLKDFAGFGKKITGTPMSNKFVVTGKKSSEDGLANIIDETIDLFVDRIKGEFKLDEPRLLDSVQEHDRIKGMKAVYRTVLKDIRKVLVTP